MGFRAQARLDKSAAMKRCRPTRPVHQPSSAFAGFRFPSGVILIAVRWYLRYGLSYRDLEELLAERGVEVDHVTLFRWVQRFTPVLVEAARPCRHAVGCNWFVDETYVKVCGTWRYVYRAVDQNGQIIDVFLSRKRDLKAAAGFFTAAIDSHGGPTEITTDRAHALVRAVVELGSASRHRPVRQQPGRSRPRTAKGQAETDARTQTGPDRQHCDPGSPLIQNIRRDHYELGVNALPGLTVAAAFDELALAV
jgi:transposase, IS6 family